LALGLDTTRLGRTLVKRRLLSDGRDVLTHEQFLAAVRRERALADRAERSFAVIVIDLRHVPAEHMASVPELTRHLVRETDDVGWFDHGSVGILLPGEDRTRAEVVVAKLRQAVGDLKRVAVRVYVHGDSCTSPEDCTDAEPPTRRQGPEPCRELRAGLEALHAVEDDRASTALDDLLATPLPEWKRAMDVVGAAWLLAVLSPVLLGVAVAVRCSSPGPVIFKQKRAGLGGRPFTFFKFRTMVRGAEAQKAELLERNEMTGPAFKIADDPRVTPLGKLLRRTSLDELPQLVNVLLGDMTLVGPRPPTLDEVPHYRPWQRHRLDVTGGITCLWQVSGRCTIAFEEWMRMDARYIQRRSPALDLELLWKTVGAVVSGKGAS